MKIEHRYKIIESYDKNPIFEVLRFDGIGLSGGSYFQGYMRKFFFWKEEIWVRKQEERWNHLYNYGAHTKSTIFNSLDEAMDRIKIDIEADYNNEVAAQKSKDYGKYQYDIVAVMEDGELKITTEKKKIDE